MGLSLKDKRILYELDLDSRQPVSSLAKKVGLKKETTNYRIKKLQEKRIIKQYYAVLNTLALGYMHFNCLFRFNSPTKDFKKRIHNYCINHANVIWVVTCYGNWDFSISFLAKSTKEYDSFMHILLERFGSFIHEKLISLMIESPTFTREYLIESKRGKVMRYTQSQRDKIDQTDHKILSLLSKNASLRTINIAEQLDLTVDIVRYRIKQLKKRGIIQGYRISLNLEKINYLYYKILFSLQNITLEKEREFKEFCKRNPHIIQFNKYLGSFEYQVELEVPNERKLFDIFEKMRDRFSSIIKTSQILRLKEEKLDYYPF